MIKEDSRMWSSLVKKDSHVVACYWLLGFLFLFWVVSAWMFNLLLTITKWIWKETKADPVWTNNEVYYESSAVIPTVLYS